MKKITIILLSCLLAIQLIAKEHQLIVHIAHGSRPHPEHRDKQKHWLGGMLGGHVVIELDSFAYGFNFESRRVHIFPRKKDSRQAGVFEKENAAELMQHWRNNKVTSVYVPINDSDYIRIRHDLEQLHEDAPFDYAFWGMRCASTAYMFLSRVEVFEKAGKSKSIRKAFHPRALRKKLLRAASKKGLRVEVHPGTSERIWEGDRKK
jgi:hypothetical protein